MNDNNNQSSLLTLAGQSGINSSIQAHVVSQTPGRIRMRVAHAHRQKHKLDPVVSALKEKLAIYRVRANLHSGSITVFHSEEQLNSEDIRQILRDLGLILHDMIEEPLMVTHGHSDAAAEVSRVAADLNQRVKRVTKGAVDLRFLLPLSFVVLACRQLVVKGLQFEVIPWYVLAWYAFDSFIKLHGIDEPS
jgi:hypothetical protein